MPPFLPSVSRHDTLKYSVGRSFCSSYRHNSRNLERPWYGLWCQVLTDLTEEFTNMIVVPQFPLWYIPEEDEAAVVEVDDDDSIDGMDLFRQRDPDEQDIEAKEAEEDTEVGNTTTGSVGTIAGTDAAELIPDFVILHLRAEKLPANHARFKQLRGIVITHECCPAIVENKKAAPRSFRGKQLERAIIFLLDEAREQLAMQCYHLFEKYPHALETIAIAAVGDYWSFKTVHRYEIPRVIEDTMDYQPWNTLIWPSYTQLATPASDQRLRKIYDTLKAKPVLGLEQ